MEPMDGFVKGKECGFMGDLKELIVYEDQHIIVCHKPPGFPVQSAGTGVMDLECACMNYLHGQDPGRQPFVGIVQRLDQPAEGLMAVAKDKRTAAELGKQALEGRMEKIYLAVAEGRAEPEENDLEDWMIKDSRLRMGKIVAGNHKGAKKARMHYKVLDYGEGKSLLEIRLFTGRYHQIRLQLSHRGWPLAGDMKYGGAKDGARSDLGLCAYRLRLIHPVSKKEMHWKIQPKGDAFVKWRV